MGASLSQTISPRVLAFDAVGVGALVRVGPRELAQRVRQALPPGARERVAQAGDAEFELDREADGGYVVAGPSPENAFRTGQMDGAIDRLRTELLEHVAVHAPDHLFVRAGAAAMGGRAIVLAGTAAAGTSELVAALVREGATFYGDGYVPIDSSGQVHPYPLHPPWTGESSQDVGRTPVPVAIIATLVPGEGTPLTLREGSPEDGILMLLHHARAADLRPEFALRAARAAAQPALALEGEHDDADRAAATLIERLARLPREAPPQQGAKPPPAIEFVTLVLDLEGQLVELAGEFERAGVDAVLLNGPEVRPALAHRFALSFSADIEIPRDQTPRALGAMRSANWRAMPPQRGRRFFRGGAVVRLRAPPPSLLSARRVDHGPLVKGRLGFLEPEANLAGGPKGSSTPAPFDPGGPLRTGPVGAALQLAAEALTMLDTVRLRTSEREFRDLAVQHGPGVFSFQTATVRLVDAILARLPAGKVRVVEVGTGTGAVALSVARERPDADVLATDLSLRALGWARRNRRRLGVRNVRLAQGSLLAPVPVAWHGSVVAIAMYAPLALPAYTIELTQVLYWPLGTATGPGADGLGLIRALAHDAREVLAPGGYLHLAMLGQQGRWIANWLDELGYQAEIPPEVPLDDSNQGVIEVAARWPGPRPS